MNFFTLALQCCDADEYLELGRLCANAGECYHPLRPMGALLWFSLPYRLGFDPSTLIFGHLALTLLSITLSVIGLFHVLTKMQAALPKKFVLVSLVITSLLSHALFLYPVFWNSLSDAPASLFALMGVWLLLLAHRESRSRMIWHALAGLSLGAAVWMRVFFLYPVLITLGVWMLYWLDNRQKKFTDLGILLAIVPLLIQFHATWNKTGELAFLDKKSTRNVSTIHMSSDAIGYDTIEAGHSKSWRSSCENYSPMGLALLQTDLRSIFCLLSGRANFYWGSYSPHTYNSSIRIWSIGLLFLNSLAFAIALLFLIRMTKQLGITGGAILLFLGLSCGLALMIVPEQRFLIVPMIAMWVFFFSWITILAAEKYILSKKNHD